MLTPIFIISVILLILIYDIWALLYYGVDGTISRVIRSWGTKWPLLLPIVAFTMGLLFGHFFL
jgi:dolichyl-phosphate-mannose--protein O-mannosyl transferase